MTTRNNVTSRQRPARNATGAERRRAQILRAAETLMARLGFHATSVQAVADRAGISVGLIYQYFTDKHQLLLAVITNILEEFRRELPIAIAAQRGVVEQLTAGFGAYCRVIGAHRAGAVLAYQESTALDRRGRAEVKRLEVETARPLADVIHRGQQEGTFTLEHDPLLVSHDLVVLAQAWALKHWHLKTLVSLDEYVDQQLRLVLRGLTATTGPTPTPITGGK